MSLFIGQRTKDFFQANHQFIVFISTRVISEGYELFFNLCLRTINREGKDHSQCRVEDNETWRNLCLEHQRLLRRCFTLVG